MRFIRAAQGAFGNAVSRVFGIDWGRLYLATGVHEIFIPTEVQPNKVWVSIDETRHSGCGISYNACVSYKIEECDDDDDHDRHRHHPTNCGFTIYADVKSEQVRIDWTIM